MSQSLQTENTSDVPNYLTTDNDLHHATKVADELFKLPVCHDIYMP